MSHSDTCVNTCVVLGHLYSDTLVIRCLHDESSTVTTRTWIDLPNGETQVLFEFSARCGPFDTPAEIESVVQQLTLASTNALLSWSAPSVWPPA